jgi:hypothetical protein
MEFSFAHFPIVGARGCYASLVNGPNACAPVVGPNAVIFGARPLFAVWELDPFTRQLEMRWAAGQGCS